MRKQTVFKTELGDIRRDNEHFWNNLFCRFLEGSETYQSLSQLLGLDSRTIRSIFDEYGWIKKQRTHLKTSQGYLSKSDREDWIKYYEMYSLGKSYEEVSTFLNIERKVLCKYFNLFKFEKRTMSESCKLGVSKMNKTCQERLKVNFPTQSEEVRSRVKQTVIDRYRVDNVAKVEEFKNKIIETNIKRYGVRHTMSNRAIRDKAVETNRVKYNSDNYKTSELYRNKVLSKYAKIWSERLGIYGYELLDDFKGGKAVLKDKRLFVKYNIRHKECGTCFMSALQTIPICPKCFSKSKAQVDLFNYIKGLGFEPTLNNRSAVKGIELDIYIPELKIAFEYNGLYWHREEVRDKNYHRNKTQICLDSGIKLYHIWSSDPTDIVKSKINQVLGVVSCRYKANNLKLSFVKEDVYKDFMDKNHLHGYSSCSFSYGLFYEQELIQCISFKLNKDIMENTRFATKMGHRVDFGFSKLLKHSIEYIKGNYGIDKIITFAYRDWTPDYRDSVYYKNGFKFLCDSGAMMFYTDGRVLYSRQRFMKHKLKEIFPLTYDERLTEKQILALNGIYSIYNSGNLKFELSI